MDITALFDDADSAEHALVNLQALGIFPTRYKIRALHITNGAGRDGIFFANTAASPGSAPVNAGAPGFGFAGGIAFSGGEPPNREVQLLLTVEDTEAHRAQSALISNHARRVRMV
ncbi:MAG: hypothetical protein LBI19_08175 [Oscillospiraceae bacterium]|jgi:hypothetical protein|nr:hypothetical protein [Oscillospiraceae bacterium]